MSVERYDEYNDEYREDELLSLSLKDKIRKLPASHNRSRELNMAIVADLYCRGLKQYEIAEHIGVSPSTVSNMIADIRSTWIEAQIESFDMRVSRELAKIDQLEREAWAAWSRSIGVTTRVTRKEGQTVNSDGELINISDKTETDTYNAGNAKFLQIVDTCIGRRIDLLGLKAPTRKQISVKIKDRVNSLAEQFNLDPHELASVAEQFAGEIE